MSEAPVIGTNASSGGGGAPSGAAGGELAGTYPNPTVKDAVIDDANIVAGGLTNAALAAAAGIVNTKLATNPLARANHTGTQLMATISDAGTLATKSTVASADITDGTIVSGDLNAAAGITSGQLAGSIAPSKITGTAVTAADTGTVTSAMIADATIVTGDLSATAGITNGQLAGSILQGAKILDRDYYLNGAHTYRETFPRNITSTATAPAGWASGVMLNTALVLYAGDVVTNLTYVSGGTGESGGTHLWVALYDTSLNLVTNSQSTDQTGATAFGSATAKTFGLGAAFTVVTSGVYYASIMVTGTVPNLQCINVGSTVLAGTPVTGQKVMASTSGSGLTTTAPASISSPTTIVAVAYVCTS